MNQHLRLFFNYEDEFDDIQKKNAIDAKIFKSYSLPKCEVSFVKLDSKQPSCYEQYISLYDIIKDCGFDNGEKRYFDIIVSEFS